jgi:hypothetical protein
MNEKEYKRKWALENKEKIKERMKIFSKNNKEHLKEDLLPVEK